MSQANDLFSGDITAPRLDADQPPADPRDYLEWRKLRHRQYLAEANVAHARLGRLHD